MPLNAKGQKIMKALKKQYGKEAEKVFYSMENSGKIKGVTKRRKVIGS